jgi:hypothetical protein
MTIRIFRKLVHKHGHPVPANPKGQTANMPGLIRKFIRIGGRFILTSASE